MWLIVALEEHTCWVKREVEKSFRGKTMRMLPESNEHLPALIIKQEQGESEEFIRTLANEFLSRLCWTMKQPFRLKRMPMFQSVAVHPRKLEFISLPPPLDLDYLVDPPSGDGKLALALYREGVNAENDFHKFLTFFRIINIGNDSGAEQKAWINKAIAHLADHRALTRIRQIRELGQEDIGRYLYKQSRCAIAHAYKTKDTVSPDDAAESLRIYEDIVLIRELAILRIRTDFQILSRDEVREAFPFALEAPGNVWNPLAGLR